MKVEVPTEDIRAVMRLLKQVEPDMARQLRLDLKGELKPIADRIASKVPSESPLSGMRHSGRTQWSGARGSVSFTPAKVIKGRDVHPLVTIVLQGKSRKAGYDIAEIAGSRNMAFSKSRTTKVTRRGADWSRKNSRRNGDSFVTNLEPRSPFPSYQAGRFGYGYFLRERSAIQKQAADILKAFGKKVEKKLRKL